MDLMNFSVSGFRSLMRVEGIPVSSPTLVAGHNDGGKTALLDGLSFLLGEHTAEEADLTYTTGGSGERCATIVVEGQFALDEWEQQTFQRPSLIRIRRISDGTSASWELRAAVPTDPRLRDLSQHKAPELAALMKDLGLPPVSLKEQRLAALRAYGQDNSSGEDWIPLPKDLKNRLPRLLSFDGTKASAENAIKVALSSSFSAHIKDPSLQGKLTELEEEVRMRLSTESKSLCDHIMQRCPDITDVVVEPDVSFSQALRGTRIRISRKAGGPVDLTRSGLGSQRRISLAIWEWTSELLADQAQEQVTDGEKQATPLQTIVVYDEPDTHLDYTHQRKVMDLIREQSAIPHVNVVVATHSMNLIDGVDIADVVHLKIEDGHSVVERLGTETHDNIDNFLGKIAASVGLRNSVLLHERYFLAVEGDTEQQAVPHLFRLSQGLSLQAAGVALWSCDNNAGALHLGKYLVQHGRNVLVMIDADSQRESLFKEASLRRIFEDRFDDVVVFVGQPDNVRELEELFNDELWARVANERWPRPEPWTPADFTRHRAGKKFSGDVQEMLQTESELGPAGKPAMMVGLALSLRSADEVPRQLREIFQELTELAAQ
ncbi:hypothetical protein GCM10011609_33730 [Lentzea pudingi]|uniref:AAA domain-containing protein n=2 Tax=Lentzea pudingi TaxID=1789439 RepID=A0ABQ2HXA4_9PSEU|nr:hypothetical protein GCM10011609_33730 [Lentzea pudingi]